MGILMDATLNVKIISGLYANVVIDLLALVMVATIIKNANITNTSMMLLLLKMNIRKY